MRPTPETDGIEFQAIPGMMPPYNTVPSEFARKLERERDEAREALQRLADCDWVIALPDRMDAVRKIAREALFKPNAEAHASATEGRR